mmetsp:Transcript_3933/g.9418  ORF Transcript_3933/g.9418 Transcript_3933/m.9418 type:complete len:310 (-) Transcript_3933:500-1429(-)
MESSRMRTPVLRPLPRPEARFLRGTPVRNRRGGGEVREALGGAREAREEGVPMRTGLLSRVLQQLRRPPERLLRGGCVHDGRAARGVSSALGTPRPGAGSGVAMPLGRLQSALLQPVPGPQDGLLRGRGVQHIGTRGGMQGALGGARTGGSPRVAVQAELPAAVLQQLPGPRIFDLRRGPVSDDRRGGAVRGAFSRARHGGWARVAVRAHLHAPTRGQRLLDASAPLRLSAWGDPPSAPHWAYCSVRAHDPPPHLRELTHPRDEFPSWREQLTPGGHQHTPRRAQFPPPGAQLPPWGVEFPPPRVEFPP